MAANRCLPDLQSPVLQKERQLLPSFFLWHKENSQLMLNSVFATWKTSWAWLAKAISTTEHTGSLLCQNQQSWPQGSTAVYLILRASLWVINYPAVYNSWQLLFSANTLYVFLVTEHFILLSTKAPSVSEGKQLIKEIWSWGRWWHILALFALESS